MVAYHEAILASNINNCMFCNLFLMILPEDINKFSNIGNLFPGFKGKSQAVIPREERNPWEKLAEAKIVNNK